MERQAISWRRLFVRHLLWVPMIPLAVGVVFSLIAWSIIAEANLLDREGVDTLATVTARDIRTERDDNDTPVTRYFVSFDFVAEGGDPVSARASVSRSTHDALPPGSTTSLRHLPGNPGVHRLALEGSGRGGAIAMGLFGLAALVGGGGTGLWLLRGKLSAVRAARYGEVREAQVVEHVATGTSINGRLQHRFRWIDARREAGQSTLMDLDRLPALGQVLRVQIDPKTGRGWSELDF